MSASIFVSRRDYFRRLWFLLANTSPLYAGRKNLSLTPLMAVQDFAQYPNVITPIEDFFVRNHFTAPRIEVSSWSLRVEGAVEQPRVFRYDDLRLMRHREVTATVECAGNGVGEGAVGCAVWGGPTLKEVLRECRLKESARYVRFVGADRGREADFQGEIAYSRSIALDQAMEPASVLALEMNGAQLPLDNGFPARSLVAGSYGMDSVKWLHKIEVLDGLDNTFFMTRRYLRSTDGASVSSHRRVAPMQIKSIIVTPVEAAVIRGTSILIGGYAWAGSEKVDRVEVSMDGGKSWLRTQLLTNSQPFGWVPWRFLWERVQPGVQNLVARAFGESGAVQPSTRSPGRTDQYELNEYHQVFFRTTA